MIGFIGGGNMAEAIIKGLTSNKTKNICVSEPISQRRQYIETAYGVDTTDNNVELVSKSDIVFLAVKPQAVSAVAEGLSGIDLSTKTIVSIAAGVSIAYLRQAFKTDNVVRVMPNTPALVLKGMSVISTADGISPETTDTIGGIFASIGKTLYLPESYMDAVTALSGSGPAFIAFFVKCMIEGAVKLGLDYDTASTLAIQTLVGTSTLLEGRDPETVIKMVSSPGGTTVAGLKVLDDTSGLIADTLRAAAQRSAELNIKT